MKESFITRNSIIAIYAICVGLMVLGSFFDFQISSALYNESSIYGIVFASYGEVPMYLGATACGTILIAIKKEDKFATAICDLLGVLFIAVSLFAIVYNGSKYFDQYGIPMPVAVRYLISAAFNLVTILFWVRICKENDKKTCMRMFWMIFCTCLGTSAVINALKLPWARPRMRLISSNDLVSFQPWWVIGSDMRDHLISTGISKDEFKSFPSAHTGSAANALLLSVLSYVKPAWKKYQKPLFVLGLAFSAIVASSRIIMGAHFLSDVTVGFTVSFTVFIICNKFILEKNN